jgi:hypothetical protein
MSLLSDYHQAVEMNAYAATLPCIKIPSSNTHPMMTRSKTKKHVVFTPVLSPMDTPTVPAPTVPTPVLIPPVNRLYAVASEMEEDHSKCGKNCSLRQFVHWPTPAMTTALAAIEPEVHTPIIESGAAGGSTEPVPSPKPEPKVFSRQNPPTWEEYCAMDSSEYMRWECLVCGEPAIAGSWQPGRLCSANCAYIKYTV